MSTTYCHNKEQICVGCSTELNQKKIEKSSDIFTGLTKQGKSIKDLLSSVVKEELDETMVGRKLCHHCCSALNHIGELYESFVRKRALVKYQPQSEVIKVML